MISMAAASREQVHSSELQKTGLAAAAAAGKAQEDL